MSPPSNDDDNPTVIRTGGALPTAAHPKTAVQARTEAMPTTRGAASPGSDDTLALPVGTKLGEFELTKRIGEGGFGIVYQAWDHTLDRHIALKEYLPASIATRVGATRISCRSDRHRETFDAGLKSFINEAKLLARFDHPSLVKVFRFWEANGTAYMVMPFYEGVTMRDTVRAMGTPPDEAWLMEKLAALTEALAVIHAEQCYHRDIAPDNVMLLSGSQRPLLLDFGAARRVIGDMTQALTVILKPGYAPVEQYAEVPGMKQGAWTDVYALAAVVYWCIAGKTPPPSVGRMLHDSCQPLAELGAGRYSAPFLEAIDRALVVRPENRTQNIDDLRHDLGMPPPAVPGAAGVSVRIDPDATIIRSRSTQRPGTTQAPTAAPVTAPRTAARTVGAVPAPTAAAPATTAPRTVAAGVSEAPPPNRTGLLLGMAGAGLVVLAAGGWWLMRPTASAPTPPVVAAPTPAPAPPPVVAKAPEPAPAPAPTAAPAPPPPASPRSPADAFAQWKAARDPALQVSVRASAPAAVAGRDPLRMSITSGQAGYLSLLAYRTGSNELVLWHPAGADGGQRIEANAPTEISAAAWAGQIPAPGVWRLMALVTRQPANPAAAGWRAFGGALVRSFDTGALASSSACPLGAPPCDHDFGAEEFTVDLQPEAKLPPPAPVEHKPARPAPEAKPDGKANAAECARIIQQMSLGETSADLSERFKRLGCR